MCIDALQAYIDEKYQKGRKDGKGGLSAKSVCHHKGILSQALTECVKDGLIPSNPCQYVEMPRRERYEAHFYNVEQLQRLIIDSLIAHQFYLSYYKKILSRKLYTLNFWSRI